MMLAGSVLWMYSNKKSQNPVFAFIFALNSCVHMMLDTLSNQIFWLAPHSYRGFSADSLLTRIVPSIVDEHPYWSFSIEAMIIVLAVYLFLKNRNTSEGAPDIFQSENPDPAGNEPSGKRGI